MNKEKIAKSKIKRDFTFIKSVLHAKTKSEIKKYFNNFKNYLNRHLSTVHIGAKLVNV